jgi:hypothetical protein
MKRKIIFLSLCLLLVLYVVPTFSQATDDADKFARPSIDVIADEDLAEPSSVPQTKETLNKGKGKGNNKPNKTPEEPKSTNTTNTPVLEVNAANNTTEQVPEKSASDKPEKSTPVPEVKTSEQPAENIPQDTQPVDAAQVPEIKANSKTNNNNKGNKRNPHQKPADDIAVAPEIIPDSAPTDQTAQTDQTDQTVQTDEPEPTAPVDNEPVIESEPEAVIDDQYYQDSYDDQYDIPQVNYDIPLDQLDQFADRYEPVHHVEPEPEVIAEPEIKPEPVAQKQEIPAHNKGSTHKAHEEVAQKPNVVKETKQNSIPEVQQQQQGQGQKDVGHRNIEVHRQNTESVKQKQERERFEREQREQQQQFNEEDYFKLIGDHSKDYINQYKVYSEHFFNYVEGLFDEAVVPLYRQVRQHEYLSMGLSSLIGFYILITFTRLFLSLFRKKPKFRYNKEETISQSDINANFKKFLGELESLKKQIAATPKGGVATASEGSAGTVSIPATLQQDLSTIINSLARNDDTINRVIRDKGKSDTFLMDFQKEVVESHKAIWNELYQLRKIFSSGKVNPSSAVKARPDADDTKSLSSNPEVTEQRVTRATPKTVGEPRSKSVTPADPVRSRPAVPKEKKPVEVEPTFTPSVNGHTQQEENKPQSATNVDKIPFGRPLSKEEEPQPAVQIPTNLNENDPTHNPFATGHPTHPTPTNTTVNAKPGIPFGNPALRGKPNIVKPSGMPMPNQNAAQTNAESNSNLLAKPELSASRKSSMDVKGNVPAPVLNMPTTLQPTFEQPVEKAEEKIPANPEQEGTVEETQTTEEGESENKGGFIPPMKPGGPGGMGPAFPRGKPMVPGNKPVPQVRRSGPPGTTVFKGPPGNLPRPGIPTQIKPSGPIPEGVPKTNNNQV